jgi:hypothetical protein
MSTQYGRNSEKVQPSHPIVKRPPRGNAYGKGHDKLDAPAQFFERQAEAVAKAAAEIVELEEKLTAAKQRRTELEEGIQVYASISLLTQLRKSVAPMFAAGPTWTILRAIAGTTGNEVLESMSSLSGSSSAPSWMSAGGIWARLRSAESSSPSLTGPTITSSSYGASVGPRSTPMNDVSLTARGVPRSSL